MLYFSIKVNFIKLEDSPLLLDYKLLILRGYTFLLVSKLDVVVDGHFIFSCNDLMNSVW